MLVEMQTGAITLENRMEFPNNIKSKTFFWPSDTTFGNIPKESWNTSSKEYIHLCIHSSIIYNTIYLEYQTQELC